MAIKSTTVQSTVSVKFKTGVDKKGKDVLKNQKFSNVKVTASDDDIYTVASAIGNLLMYPIAGIVRDNSNEIINQ